VSTTPNETKRQAVLATYHVESCRGCGRTYRFRAPNGLQTGDGARGRCEVCGATNATRQQVNPSTEGER